METSSKGLPIKKIITYVGIYLGIVLFLAIWWYIRMSRVFPRTEIILPSGQEMSFTADFSEIHRIGLSLDDPGKQDITENGVMTDVSINIFDTAGNSVYEKEIPETEIRLFELNIDEAFDGMPVMLNKGEKYTVKYSGKEIKDGLLTIGIYGREASLFPLFIISSILVLVVVSLCIFGISKTEGLLNLKLYFVIFAILSIMMTIILAPYSVQDEMRHFGMSYSLSNKMLGLPAIDENDNVYLFQNGLSTVDWCDTAQNAYHFWNFNYGSTPVKMINTTVRVSDSLQKQAYFLPALGITLARLFKAPYQIVLLSGRLMNLLLFVFVGYFSLRIMPVFRDGMKALLLFPSVVWMACSYSYDTWNLAFSLAFFAYVIYLKYREKKVFVPDLVILSIILYLLVPIKFIYFLMAVGIFLLNGENFKNRIWQWGTYIWIIGFGAYAAIYHRGMSATSFMGNRIDERATVAVAVNTQTGQAVGEVVARQSFSLAWIFESKRNLLYTIEMVINTLFDQSENYLYKLVNGQYLNIEISKLLVFGILIVAVIIMLDECREMKFSLKDKLVAAAGIILGSGAVLATFLFIYSFVHITEIGTIGGVQGRYFLPFFLYIPFILTGGHIKLTRDRSKYAINLEILMVLFSVMLNLSALIRR